MSIFDNLFIEEQEIAVQMLGAHSETRASQIRRSLSTSELRIRTNECPSGALPDRALPDRTLPDQNLSRKRLILREKKNNAANASPYWPAIRLTHFLFDIATGQEIRSAEPAPRMGTG